MTLRPAVLGVTDSNYTPGPDWDLGGPGCHGCGCYPGRSCSVRFPCSRAEGCKHLPVQPRSGKHGLSNRDFRQPATRFPGGSYRSERVRWKPGEFGWGRAPSGLLGHRVRTVRRPCAILRTPGLFRVPRSLGFTGAYLVPGFWLCPGFTYPMGQRPVRPKSSRGALGAESRWTSRLGRYRAGFHTSQRGKVRNVNGSCPFGWAGPKCR